MSGYQAAPLAFHGQAPLTLPSRMTSQLFPHGQKTDAGPEALPLLEAPPLQWTGHFQCRLHDGAVESSCSRKSISSVETSGRSVISPAHRPLGRPGHSIVLRVAAPPPSGGEFPPTDAGGGDHVTFSFLALKEVLHHTAAVRGEKTGTLIKSSGS